jgi:hypothetical protein
MDWQEALNAMSALQAELDEARAEGERLRKWALQAFTIVEWCCGEGFLLDEPHFDCDDALLDAVYLLGVETSDEARQALAGKKTP